MEPQGQQSPRTTANTAERRRHVRFLEEVRVRYRDIEGCDASRWGRSRDLSLGGLGLLADDVVPEGSHLAVEIHMESEPAPVLALARVLRCDALADDAGHVAGCQFLWMSADDRSQLERLAAYFRKKYGTSGDLDATTNS
ncbi:MAG: PilZ domain-containing protein [Planctomycetota bacterium]